MTNQTANATPGDGINLTQLSLTPEARAAMNPTHPDPEVEAGINGILTRARDAYATPRQVPTMAERFTDARTCGHTPEQHRHDDGQDADAASRDRAIRELTAERDKNERWAVRAEAELNEARTLAKFRKAVIDRYRDEIGAAGEVLAVVRDAQEQIERALARYDTAPEVTPVDPDGTDPAGLGSPSPRAQEEPEREEIRWAYRWIGPDGQVYDEMDASDNAIETAEQRAHRIAAKRLTGTVRGEVIRYRVLTMPAEVVATYPAEARP